MHLVSTNLAIWVRMVVWESANDWIHDNYANSEQKLLSFANWAMKYLLYRNIFCHSLTFYSCIKMENLQNNLITFSLETFSMCNEMNNFFRTIPRHSASSSESSPPPLLLPEQHSWEALDQLPGAVFPFFDRVQVLYLENMSPC